MLKRLQKWIGSVVILLLLFFPQLSRAQDLAELKKQLTDGDRESRREAVLALSELGDDALPALPELIEALEDDDEQVAGRAVMVIAAFGPNAPDAIPVLIANLDPQRRRYDEQVVYRTAFALGKIGPAAVEPLRMALSSSSDRRRFGATQALHLIGPEAASAIPELIKALRDEEPEVRQTAGEALAAIGEKAMEPLVGEFEVNSSTAVVRALGQMGPLASGMLEPLLALTPKEEALSAAIVDTLGKIGLPLEKLQDRLKQSLLDDSETIRISAANVLLTNEGSLEMLQGWLGDDNKKLRQRAAWVVGQFGADAAHLAPELIAKIDRGDEAGPVIDALKGLGAGATGAILNAVSEQPVEALRRGKDPYWAMVVLQSVGPLAMPMLEEALDSESAATRFVALDSLAELGKITKPLEPKFRKATNDPEPAVRLAALVALDASGADPARMANILHRRCADESGEVRAIAIRLLGEIGGDDRAAFAIVDKALGDSDSRVRVAAIGALIDFGSEAQGSVPRLLELADRADTETRLAILKVLAATGTGATNALPLVRSSLEDPAPSVRGAAINALVAIDPDSENLTGVLADMLSHEDVAVRHPAIKGLGKLGEAAALAAPQLFDLLNEEADRGEVLEALLLIRSRDVDLYLEALKNNEPRVRLFACEALGRLGKAAEKAIPQLEKAKRDRYDFVRRRASDAIKRIRR